MKKIEQKLFINTTKGVLKSFNVLPTNKKALTEIEHKLSDLCNCIFAYNMWTNQYHINSSLAHQSIKSKKSIKTYIKSQITHVDKSMELCMYRFSSLNSYFHLYTLKVLFIYFLNKENDLIDKLHEAKFRSLTEVEYFEEPYALLEDIFDDDIFQFSKLFNSINFEKSYVSEYKNKCANNVISMYKFFDSFNMTEKSLQTNFSISIFNSLKNLNLSKDKTKQIVDTIMYNLDIKTTINLKKIDNIHYIGTIYVNNIYSYEKPIIHTRFLDRKLIQKIQQEKKELALKTNNLKELEIINKMIQSIDFSYPL